MRVAAIRGVRSNGEWKVFATINGEIVRSTGSSIGKALAGLEAQFRYEGAVSVVQ